MTDWEFAQLLEDGARAAAREPSTAARLFACPSAVPRPDQVEDLQACARRARAHGLRLPRLRVLWKIGLDDVCAGAVRREADGNIFVALSVCVAPGELRRTIYHELQHVHDLAAGDDVDREAMEVAAVRFASLMMRGEV